MDQLTSDKENNYANNYDTGNDGLRQNCEALGGSKEINEGDDLSSQFVKKKRTKTSPYQLEVLQKTFETDPMPSHSVRMALSLRLGMSSRSVQVWFQNRRAKGKQEKQKLLNSAPMPLELPGSYLCPTSSQFNQRHVNPYTYPQYYMENMLLPLNYPQQQFAHTRDTSNLNFGYFPYEPYRPMGKQELLVRENLAHRPNCQYQKPLPCDLLPFSTTTKFQENNRIHFIEKNIQFPRNFAEKTSEWEHYHLHAKNPQLEKYNEVTKLVTKGTGQNPRQGLFNNSTK